MPSAHSMTKYLFIVRLQCINDKLNFGEGVPLDFGEPGPRGPWVTWKAQYTLKAIPPPTVRLISMPDSNPQHQYGSLNPPQQRTQEMTSWAEIEYHYARRISHDIHRPNA